VLGLLCGSVAGASFDNADRYAFGLKRRYQALIKGHYAAARSIVLGRQN
jgi:hypothetical protein